MIQLGLSGFYHDSAAALVIDGKVIAAIEEEKLSGIKHDSSFPIRAILYVLAIAQITIDEVDMVCWYENPDIKYERVKKELTENIVDKVKNIGKFKRFKQRFKGKKHIEGLLKTMNHRDAMIVSCYFGINGEEEQNLDEIGRRFNLTRERVRQIKEKAIKRLRKTTHTRSLRTYLGK